MFQINLKCQPFAENLLTVSGSEYVYDLWEKSDGTKEELRLYIDSVLHSKLGTTIEIQLDKESPPFYVRGEEPQRFRITARMGAHIFKIQGWPLLIGIFGQYDNALDFRMAIKKIYLDQTNSTDTPMFPVGFQLREHDDALLQRFPNMKKLRVTGIQGAYVRTAVLAGDMLEESPEYQKWVRDEYRSGIVSYFGVTVGDETVVLSTYGNMYSRQGKEARPIVTVYQILKGLIECRALIYSPTLDIY